MQQTFSGVRFTPAINPLPGKMYRLQVGSYKVPRNALDTFSKLKAVSLNPAYEQHGEFYRVVLARVSGTEIQSVADKLSRAGFYEVVVYEEK
jgi:rare lipoprotein A